ncbi:MAG: gamma-glutamyl-gamma-aminobutyrate hydrolase family protein [Lachnospiraceae bacterium]|nr:gamma-glutamyl-gamma-aminobutyrate hydrolase family protein [Lachnospiraceae bacterium]
MDHVFIAGYDGDTKNYQMMLRKMGIPFTVMSEDVVTDLWQGRFSLRSPDVHSYTALLLPGGGDITWDCLFDRQQFLILHAFVCSRKPVLGICKGMQLINLYFGGTLYEHLSSASIHCFDSIRKIDQIHSTCLLPDTYLSRLYGHSVKTNSAHHQGCALPGSGLLPAQYSVDSVLEGFYHAVLPVWGVQWHPERTSYFQQRTPVADGSMLFDFFLSTNIY